MKTAVSRPAWLPFAGRRNIVLSLAQKCANNIQPRARNVKTVRAFSGKHGIPGHFSSFRHLRRTPPDPRKILTGNKSQKFFILFFRFTNFSLDFFSPAVYNKAILRQAAQRNGSPDPLRSAVRDCLGYTDRTMRKLFRLKFASAGRSSAFSCAVHHRTEFQAASPKRFVPPDFLKRNNRERTIPQ